MALEAQSVELVSACPMIVLLTEKLTSAASPRAKTPRPLSAVLPEMVSLRSVREPLRLKMAPPSPEPLLPEAEFPLKVESVMERVPALLKIAPPRPAPPEPLGKSMEKCHGEVLSWSQKNRVRHQ
jgi:hypothetical protein